MIHTYEIHFTPNATLIFSGPSFQNIQNDASTHYACQMYVNKFDTAKTLAGFPPKPAVKPKKLKKAKSVVASVKIVDDEPHETFDIKMPRKTFRKNIDKAALNDYFDNDVLPSRAELKQENLAAMVDELEIIDAIESEMKTTSEEEIRQFVESVRDISAIDIDEANRYVYDEYDQYDDDKYVYNEYDQDDDDEYDQDHDQFVEELLMEKISEAHYEPEYIGTNSINATKEDKFERLHILDSFKKKVRRTHQERDMTKMHDDQMRRNIRKMAFDAFRSHQK